MSCRKLTSKRYLNRKGPPYNATNCTGPDMSQFWGNDGRAYITKKTKTGYRWVLKPEPTNVINLERREKKELRQLIKEEAKKFMTDRQVTSGHDYRRPKLGGRPLLIMSDIMEKPGNLYKTMIRNVDQVRSTTESLQDLKDRGELYKAIPKIKNYSRDGKKFAAMLATYGTGFDRYVIIAEPIPGVYFRDNYNNGN